MESVILVDESDREIGVEEKIKAHREAKLHRAFSIFILNSKGEMLLQKRARGKYHSAGLWTNACCSHPRPGESIEDAAHRRLKEEVGFDCDLKKAFHFIYKVSFDKDKLVEYEFDHVLVGKYDGEIKLNPKEAQDFRWVPIRALKRDIKAHPKKYTAWFKIALGRVLSNLSNLNI